MRAQKFGTGGTERVLHFLLNRSPLGTLVYWVARIQASIHAKLLCSFLLVTLLFIVLGLINLQAVTRISQRSRLLDKNHQRVDWSRQMERAFALQMHFTAMALLAQDEATVKNILRQNNQFNNMLAQIEDTAPPEEENLIQRIRIAQDVAMTTVGDIANLIRDGKLDEARGLQFSKVYPGYLQIEKLVHQVVEIEQNKMASLRASVVSMNKRVLLLVVGFGVASILMALFLGFVISWSFILPVREAQRFLSRVAEGKFDTTITVHNRDEFGVLAARMNEMGRELNRLYEYQRKTALELRMLNEQLMQASKAKSDFLANMSHELRTPLNSVIGFSEVLLDRMAGDLNPKQEEYLHAIMISGRHLLSLINDILDLSKIEAGQMELELTTFDLAMLIDDTFKLVQERASRRGIQLSFETDKQLSDFMGDERKVKAVILNLLSNAIKSTLNGGKIHVKAGLTDSLAKISVSDTGIGIAQEDQQIIFEEFRQAGDASHKSEGTGLGLTLAKKFVELHGGSIWIESEVGRGSIFTFTLPMLPHVEDAPEALATIAPSRNPLAMVIEDDPLSVKLLSAYLTEEGFGIEVAHDGDTGFEKARDLHPAIVILDIMLPRVDGWEFLARIKEAPETQNIPIIVVSVLDEPGKGFTLGAADYLIKPVRRDQLAAAIQRIGTPTKLRGAAVKVLAIDDDPIALELVGAILQDEGYWVLRATGGKEGIALAKAELPALIILDLLMPEVDGFAVVDQLRDHAATREIPIVILTSVNLNPKEKENLHGRINHMAQKGEFNRASFVDLVNHFSGRRGREAWPES